MPILNLKVDNILSFNDFEMNFSYPKKLNSFLVKDEFLEVVPTFRYKKMNIIIGSNASGKTSLVRCIWHILFFLRNKEKNKIQQIVHDRDKEAFIEVDIAEKNNLYRFKIKTNKYSNLDDLKVSIACNNIKISKGTSYEVLKKQLDNTEYVYDDYLEVLERVSIDTGWMVLLPATEGYFDTIRFKETDKEDEYIDILNRVLQTLDSSIQSIEKSKDADNAYVIKHNDIGKVIIQDGMSLRELDKISSGTKYGFNIANLIFNIRNNQNGIYLIDEQFSYVNSDIEKTFIALMATLLKNDEQVFITTHNPEVLDLGLPFHAYNFIKKEIVDGRTMITCNCASEIENRNNVNAKTILDNDVFGTVPDTTKITELGE